MSMISWCSLGKTIFLHSQIDGEAEGTLTYSQNFNKNDSATFNAEVAVEDVTINFTDSKPRLGSQAAATAEVRIL